jgi:hypothetical protein
MQIRPIPAIGQRRWAIAEGYIPGPGHDHDDARFTGHEAACLLNCNAVDAHVVVHVYFSDREPAGPYHVTVPARRTVHLRFNDLREPEPIPRETDYASVIESDQPIVVQHTRLDSRQSELALVSTVAYAASPT